MCCLNTLLQCRWRLCVYVRSTVRNAVVLAPDNQKVRPTFVLGCAWISNCNFFVFVEVRACNLTLLMYTHTLKWSSCALRACLRWMYDAASCGPWTNSWCVVYISVWLKLKLLYVFDAVWGRNLTLIFCPNTLYYNFDDAPRPCVYFCSIVWN